METLHRLFLGDQEVGPGERLLRTLLAEGSGMSPATRECGACGGDGYQRYYEFPGTKLCPVCAGSGRVDAGASRADAVADAGSLERSILAEAPNSLLAEILSDGCEAFLAFADGLDPDGMRYATRRSVRAAFRAVPGLRGEQGK
jgi:hypothetical protein